MQKKNPPKCKSKLKQILKEICADSDGAFDAYNLRRDLVTKDLKLVVWRGNQFFDPITIRNDHLLQCGRSIIGYQDLKGSLEKEIRNRLQGAT